MKLAGVGRLIRQQVIKDYKTRLRQSYQGNSTIPLKTNFPNL